MYWTHLFCYRIKNYWKYRMKYFLYQKYFWIGDRILLPAGSHIQDKNQGVKQGRILSPLHFNIFVSDLITALDEGESKPVKNRQWASLNSLIWVDDLLLLSELEHGLNNMLRNLDEYTKSNLIRVNLDKTNCMIFNKSGKLIRRTFMLGAKK